MADNAHTGDKWAAIAGAVLFFSLFISMGISMSAEELARPKAIAACVSVEGMEYVKGDCRPIQPAK